MPLSRLRPKGLIPAGNITESRLSNTPPPFLSTRKATGARAAGLRYERRVHENLLAKYAERYLPAPWFIFRSDNGPRWCQPDGLLIDISAGKIWIIEIKHSITERAWWWLTDLYVPVVRHAFGTQWEIATCTIVNWFDCKVPLPEKPVMCREVLLARPGQNAVLIWNHKHNG
jgi:hypothetical protein